MRPHTTALDRTRLSLWLVLAILVAAVDQATKRVVLAVFDVGDAISVTPFLNIVLWLNRGVAFGLLSEAGEWRHPFLLAVVLAAAVILVHLIRRAETEPLARLGYVLILGGAIGNVFDRMFLGAVVDWIDFHVAGRHWPAFNLADAAITVGAGVLIVTSFSPRKHRSEVGAKR